MNADIPDAPVVFMKPPTAILANDEPLYYPDFTRDLHYEVEAVLRISKPGKSIDPKFAGRYYDQYSLGIDFTARDLQAKQKKSGLPWEIAKGFDGSAVIGRFLPFTAPAQVLDFRLDKNGQTVQSATTEEMLFSFDTLVSYISGFFKLQTGDLIYTGTPSGVGPVAIGDVLTGYIGEERMFRCEIK